MSHDLRREKWQVKEVLDAKLVLEVREMSDLGNFTDLSTYP